MFWGFLFGLPLTILRSFSCLPEQTTVGAVTACTAWEEKKGLFNGLNGHALRSVGVANKSIHLPRLTVRVATYLAQEIASLFRPALYHPVMSLTDDDTLPLLTSGLICPREPSSRDPLLTS